MDLHNPSTWLMIANTILSAFAAIGHLFSRNTIISKAADDATVVSSVLSGAK